jgi:cell division protein ZapA (FtsZ GTPase activity inhibitor)
MSLSDPSRSADHDPRSRSGSIDDGRSQSAAREPRSVDIEIAGRRFKVRSDDDEAYIQTLVGFVDHKLDNMRRASNLVDREQVALLTLLDVADALFRERRGREADRARISGDAADLRAILGTLRDTLGATSARGVDVASGASLDARDTAADIDAVEVVAARR